MQFNYRIKLRINKNMLLVVNTNLQIYSTCCGTEKCFTVRLGDFWNPEDYFKLFWHLPTWMTQTTLHWLLVGAMLLPDSCKMCSVWATTWSCQHELYQDQRSKTKRNWVLALPWLQTGLKFLDMASSPNCTLSGSTDLLKPGVFCLRGNYMAKSVTV